MEELEWRRSKLVIIINRIALRCEQILFSSMGAVEYNVVIVLIISTCPNFLR